MAKTWSEIAKERGYKTGEEKLLEIVQPKSYQTRQTHSMTPTKDFKISSSDNKETKKAATSLSLKDKQDITNATKKQKYVSPAREALKSETVLPKTLKYGPSIKKTDPIQTVRKTTWKDIAKERGYVEPIQQSAEPVDEWKENPIKSLAKNAYAGFGDLGRATNNVIDMALGDKGIEFVDNYLMKSKEYAAKEDEELNEINSSSKYGQTLGAISRGLGQGVTSVGMGINSAPLAGVSPLMTANGTRLVSNAAQFANPTNLFTAQQVAKEVAKNPNFVPSMIQGVGSQYEQAINNGATRDQAIQSAIVSGIPSGIIEVSGGLETLSAKLANKTTGVIGKAARSGLEEGLEEVLQYPVENLGQKLSYDTNMPLFSTKETSVINPLQMAEAGLIGGTVGALMGGGGAAINSELNKKYSNQLNIEYENIINTLPENSKTMEKVKKIKDNGAGVTDDVKTWIVSMAKQEYGSDLNFESETDKLLQNIEPTVQTMQNENNSVNQVVNNKQIMPKTQSIASTSSNPTLNAFKIKNVDNGVEVKKNIYNFYKNLIISDSYVSKPIVNKNTGMKIEVSRATINQTFQFDDKYKNAQDNEIKIAAMANLTDIIQNGQTEIIDQSEKPSSKKTYANVIGVINVNGIPYNITLDVRQSDNGNKFFVHSLHTDIEQSNKTSGIINNGYEQKIDPQAYTILDKIGQATGVKIKIVSNIASPDGSEQDFANGQYIAEENTIEISLLSSNPVMVVAKHEITHMLQKQSPELYYEYKKYVIDALKENGTYEGVFDDKTRLYRQRGVPFNVDYINDEIVSDATETFLTNEKSINDIVQNNPKLGQKILDIIKQFIKRVNDAIGLTSNWMGTEDLKKAEKLWVNALNSAIENKKVADINVGNIQQEVTVATDEKQFYESDYRYSIKELDKKTLDFLNNQETVKVYRAMQVIDGKLYPPMAAKVKSEDGKKSLVTSSELGKWEQSVERPDLIKNGNKFNLDKANGSSLDAAYNPYFHTSLSPLNDQFSSAYKRDNLVVVEGEVPSSELTSGYRAEFAKDTVGEMKWHSGPVSSKLPKNKERKVILSRWFKPVRIVSDTEVASKISKLVEGENLDIPYKVVTPSLREELEKVGVAIRFSLKEPIEETKDLIAIHNITEEKLKGALELGGFPVPSIAILKAKQIHEGFGDLSVIFTKDTINPTNRQNKIFASDVYSPTFPRVSLNLNDKVTEKIRNRVYAATSETDYRKKFNSYFDDENMSDKIERAKGNFVEAFKEDPLLQLTYLKEKNIPFKPIMREKRYGSIETKILEKVVKKLGNRIPETYLGVDGTMKFEPEIRQIVNEFYKEKLAGEDLYKEPFRFAKMDEYLREAKIYKNDTNRTEIDRNKTQEKLKKVVKKKGFEEWLNEISKNLVTKKGIRNKKDLFMPSGNRRSWEQLHDSYNIENVISLLKGDIRDEEGFNYGLGSLRANVSKQFKSIEDIKANKDLLVSDEEFMKVKEEYSNRYLELTSRAMAYHSSKYGNGYDSSMSSLAKKGAFTPSALKREFKEDGFNKEILTDNELIKDSLDFLQELKDMPTSYFEAKPQRAVDLEEIAAVVLPKTTDKELLQQLKDKNIKAVKYDDKIEGDRLRAVNSVKNVRFQLKDNSSAKQIEQLKNANERLKEEFKLTKGVKLDEAAIKKLGRSILKDYSSKYDKVELESRMKDIYIRIANNDIEYDEMLDKIKLIARDIIENASVLNDYMHKQYAALRNTLRNTAITIGDKYKDDLDGGYNTFRKKNIGKIRLTNDGMNVDILYQELIEQYPELFNPDITNQADQLMLIEDVLNGLTAIYENPFNRDMNEAIEYLSVELFEDFTSVPAAKATFADKKKLELDETKTKDREKIKQLKVEQKDNVNWIKHQNKDKIKQIITNEKLKREAAITKTKKKYSGDAYTTWWKNKLKENDLKSHYQEMIKELRTSKNDKIERTASRYKERISTIYEDRKVREVKGSIARKAKRLGAMLMKPTQKQHIPKIFTKTIAELLSQINLETDKQKEGTILKLRDLRAEYEKMAKVSDEEGMQATADPYIMDALEMLHGKRLSDMNLDELEIFNNIVGYFEHMVKGYNKAFINGKWVNISDKSESILNELKTNKPVTESAYGTISAFKDMMQWGMVTPQMFFERMGETFTSLYDDFRSSLDVKISNTKIAQDYMTKLLENSKAEVKSWTGDKVKTTTFKLTNGTIELTPSQTMSLYLLFKREQARNHILGAGIKAAPIVKTDIHGIKTKIKQFEPVKVTPADIIKIIGSLSKEQRKIADGIGIFMNTYSKRWVNEATIANYGYELAKEENYFPIKTDKDFLKSDFDNTTLDPTFTSMGFLKSTVKGAANAIIIDDVFDVFTEHADKAATYNAFVTVTENTKKIINYKTQAESIKQSMSKKYGMQAFNYLKKFMVDLQGGLRTEGGPPIVNTLIRNTKRSLLGLNMRTVIQQPTAIIRASALIDIKYLIKGVSLKSDLNEMLEHSPIALWKSWGYFNLDTGRTMKDIILNTTPILDKQYLAIQKADDITWTKLWNAVKLEINDTMPSLTGNEYFEAVSKRFTEITDKTQVVDTVMHRSDIMRQKDSNWKILTAFMSEPTKTYNLLLNAKEKYSNDKSEANKKAMLRTMTAWIATTAVNTFIISLVDMWRRDDDDDEALLNRWINNAINEVTGMVPLLRDLSSILQGYSVKRMEYNGIEKVGRAIIRTRKYILEMADKKEHIYPIRLITKDWIESVAYVFGVGANNVSREIEALLKNYIRFTGSEEGALNNIYKFMFIK